MAQNQELSGGSNEIKEVTGFGTGVANVTKTRKSWRDVLPIHPAAELLPLMSPDELRELADDLNKRGLLEKVNLYTDENGEHSLLDGRNRLDALELNGIEIVDTKGEVGKLYGGYTNCINYNWISDPVGFVIAKNIRRRHLNQEQKRELLAKLLKFDPYKSNRQVAKAAGVDHKTVAAVRAEVEGRGEIPHVETITDTQGREQPAKKSPPRRDPEDDDEDCGPAETPEERRERLERGKRWTEAATRAWIADHPGHTAADFDHWSGCAATDEEERHWLDWFDQFSLQYHKAMPAVIEVPDEATPYTVSVPKKDYTAAALKDLRRSINALDRVLGIVRRDKTLVAQLERYADALETLHDTIERVAGNKTFDGPCDFFEALEKAARRDKKFRDAINLTGYGQRDQQS